ncbi:aminotransferase class I/II-fold pyridoxal phosphate-dependent enzyme [Acidaminobacter hydrogenoformans]|uniref:Arginine/lysine/ornithine decarboxylase n=1 Tax=Acidaminobacter hydrogenoformans DSM 2784 TaxID=1120920 RepID=A0A1G5RZ03_9FIRM|nr:aminotransferase class I/II-fold pyridoxal phosphate-dependent enzyme [Acidaminobacter hydrogenoformans]SCZ79226.1 Arginine/lysine/ornithine decarboxylase [Acidaminobacter hydrogenoformans DSM 2784]
MKKAKNESLFSKLAEMRHAGQTSFHVPGNKFGRGLSCFLTAENLSLEALDYTEIHGTDNLHAPEGVILEAQRDAARIFGARETQFLVGGTTVGILGAVLGTVPRGAKIILPRDAHRSVLSAVLMGGLKPVYLLPEIDTATGIALGVSADMVKGALRSHSDAAAVLITYPNYEGVACDLKSIIEIAHSHNTPVIVDEAHGAHFGLSGDLPETALSLGADIAVQSTHKTLTSLTQSSMLHYGTDRGLGLKHRISSYLAMLQSSSPSYPLMVSLELAASYYEAEGSKDMAQLLGLIEKFASKAKLLGYRFMHESMALPAGFAVDRTRLVISAADLGIDGYQLYQALEEAGVVGEFATPLYVVLIPSLVSNASDFNTLMASLEKIAQSTVSAVTIADSGLLRVPVLRITALPERAVSAEAALWSEQEWIPVAEAKGRIAGDFLIPYPPGIPLLAPGEIVSEEVLRIVQSDLGIQHKVNGLSDGCFSVLKMQTTSKKVK